MFRQLTAGQSRKLGRTVLLVHVRTISIAATNAASRSYEVSQNRLVSPRNAAKYVKEAVQKLNTLQSGFSKVEQKRKEGLYYATNPVNEMREWVRRLGYEPQDFNRLNIIHVAGTKGKGSTCAYVDSILNQYRLSSGFPKKVGLYTSPHLIAVRERIRIDHDAISEELFAKYFFEVWDALEASAMKLGIPVEDKPIYFRYLTLMSFHTFLREGVDAAIYEVGIGGEFDSTNMIDSPLATGITTLGIDHVDLLGSTIDKIAWHKAGIFKKGSPAFSVDQVSAATEVVVARAKERECSLEIVPINRQTYGFNLIPNEDFQRKNASLAIRLTQECLRARGSYDADLEAPLPPEFKKGLETVVWRGRCEVVQRGKQTWYVDGAHTVDSLNVAGHWFAKAVKSQEGPRIMIFNQQSMRDAIKLLNTLHDALSQKERFHFDHVIFTTNITYKTKVYRSDFQNNNMDTKLLLTLDDQRKYAETWRSLDPSCKTEVVLSIEEALEHVDKIASGHDKAQVFAAGSLHLVGGVLFLLGEKIGTTPVNSARL